MNRYRYTDGEKEINAVLAHQDDQIKKISFPPAAETEDLIANSEAILASLGYDLPKKGTVPKRGGKPVTIPTWEELLKDALQAGKGGTELEALFTEDELRGNAAAVAALNEEYDQLHRLDPLDVTITAGAIPPRRWRSSLTPR